MIPRSAVLIAALTVLACQAPPPDRETLHSQLPERPYSGAVRVGDTYYFSGKVGVTDESRAMTERRTAVEVRNIMESYKELFAELGLDFSDVVQGSVFLADVNDSRSHSSLREPRPEASGWPGNSSGIWSWSGASC
jgi:2-iminobutanoate/2-iminopropanoate deaminase